jgi:hypothetical protein
MATQKKIDSIVNSASGENKGMIEQLYSRTKAFANFIEAYIGGRSCLPDMRASFGKSFCSRV